MAAWSRAPPPPPPCCCLPRPPHLLLLPRRYALAARGRVEETPDGARAASAAVEELSRVVASCPLLRPPQRPRCKEGSRPHEQGCWWQSAGRGKGSCHHCDTLPLHRLSCCRHAQGAGAGGWPTLSTPPLPHPPPPHFAPSKSRPPHG
jgi:hypothetical protein